ncbi:LuxR C-terminal-related transcriptional regulator [Nocardia sp. NPDC052566]|uniref:helix-turn-helix transcriptional regulator n=1 Tax=Nocardia sp. NPDC052566 TaxID=3364330 RepID=UPI0037CC9C24
MRRAISPQGEQWSILAHSRIGQAMAVLGGVSTAGLIAELLAADEVAVRAVLCHVGGSGAVARIADRETGERILRDVPAPVRKELHRRAAELLYDKGFPADAVADQLVAAEAPDYPWAARVLLAAAEHALASDRIDLAVERFELAYRAHRDPAERAAIAVRLVGVEWRITPSHRTRNFLRVKSAVRTGRVGGALLPSAVMFLLWHGQGQHVEHALAQVDRHRPDGDRPELDFLCAWLRYSHPPLVARHPGLGGADIGRPAADEQSPHLLGAELLRGLFAGRSAEEIATLAQRLLTCHRLATTTVETLAAAVNCLIYTDRLDTAAAWCDALLAEADARRAPTWQAIFAGLRAETMLHKGAVRVAANDAMLALNHVPAEHLGVWIGTPIAALVRALTVAGRHDEAAAQLQRDVPAALFESRFGLTYLQARGHHQLAVGRADEALRTFRRCGHLMRRWRLDVPWLVPWRNDIASAYLALGEQQHARVFATRHLRALGGADRHRTGGVSLRLLAATADRYHRVRLLRDSVAIARSCGDDAELATALGELGRAHRTVGDHDKARTLIREAVRLADGCGAELLLGDLLDGRPRPATLVPRPAPTGVGTLSPAELRVAELAALGRRNREIADELAITVSTVEQHLTRVYRKLEVARRSELSIVFPVQATG